MEMTTIPMTIPKSMAPYIDADGNGLSFAQKAMLLYPFIQSGQMSHGRAAEILGVHKLDLIDLYCGMGLPYLNQSVEDLEEEMADIHGFEGAAV